jgi:hypothetical protein
MVRYPTSKVINGPVAHGTFLPPPGEMVKRKRTKGDRPRHRDDSAKERPHFRGDSAQPPSVEPSLVDLPEGLIPFLEFLSLGPYTASGKSLPAAQDRHRGTL